MRIYRLLQIAFLSIWFLSAYAIAGISIDSTRIIFNASDAKGGALVGVTSSQQSSTPYLVKVQVIIDPETHNANNANTPFTINPSLFRLEPGTTNQLRVLKIGKQPLPKDRESLFYLRALAMPAGKGDESTPKKQVGGELIISVATAVKLFYRPADLPITQQMAMSSLQFSKQNDELVITNPSPYYITMTSLKLGENVVSIYAGQKNQMVAPMIPPFGEIRYKVKNAVGEVTWKAINDFGSTEVFHGKIQ